MNSIGYTVLRQKRSTILHRIRRKPSQKVFLKPLEVGYIRAVESEVPSSDCDSGQLRLSDSDSGPTPTFSCISYLK